MHLKVAFNWDMKPLYDVIARLPGSTYPDEWIIRGNHHDAWVNGAEDPVSGMAPMLEEARALGELLKQGWKPKRTIVYAAWDGEEPGLLGSTEWAETHADELQQNAVAYINSDGNGRGFLGAGGSHSLETFINGVARDVTDPETQRQRLEARAGAARSRRGTAEDREEARSARGPAHRARSARAPTTRRSSSTSASPSLNLGFGGEDDGGIYHSIYDDFYHYTHFDDADFAYGRALAQTVGHGRDAAGGRDLLPFEFTNLADTVRTLRRRGSQKLAETMRQDDVRERNRQIEDGVFAAGARSADSRSCAPAPEDRAAGLELRAARERGRRRSTAAADRYDEGGATLREPPGRDARPPQRA